MQQYYGSIRRTRFLALSCKVDFLLQPLKKLFELLFGLPPPRLNDRGSGIRKVLTTSTVLQVTLRVRSGI